MRQLTTETNTVVSFKMKEIFSLTISLSTTCDRNLATMTKLIVRHLKLRNVVNLVHPKSSTAQDHQDEIAEESNPEDTVSEDQQKTLNSPAADGMQTLDEGQKSVPYPLHPTRLVASREWCSDEEMEAGDGAAVADDDGVKDAVQFLVLNVECLMNSLTAQMKNVGMNVECTPAVRLPYSE